ncbi:MAG: RsmE family RNA methyltransferase [Actinomycetota bacterium]
MSAPWFYAPAPAWRGPEVVLDLDESRHALTVLRIAPPDVLTITDGSGTVARCSAARVDDGRLVAEILERDQRPRPRPEVVVYQGAAKGSKVDGVVERLAELGVAEVSVFGSQRTVVRWDESKSEHLEDRWAAIARSAAKQSQSPWVMGTGPPQRWDEVLGRVALEPCVVVLWEGASLPLRTALLEGVDRVALVVGPEGGLEATEAEALADAGGQLVSLGPQILRTENAPVVATSAVLFHYGLIG